MKSNTLLFGIAISFVLTGCFLQSNVSITASDEVILDSILISIGSGPDIVEASTTHTLNLLGLRDSFTIQEWEPKEFSSDDFLLLKPKQTISVEPLSTTGDKIVITSMGENQKKLVWTVEQRVNAFYEKVAKADAESAGKVFLVMQITFPGPVDMANTSESKGNTYTWRINKGQMSSDFKIQAIYSTL